MKITEWLNGPGKDACDTAKEWLATLPEGATMSDAWAQCQRSNWMFWAGFRSPVANNDPRWRQAAFAIVRRTEVAPGKTNWDIMPEAGRRCVEVAERYERGDAAKEERSAAESAARSAAWFAARSAARSAAESAAWSAAESAARSAARSAAESAAWFAAESAAWSAAESAAWSAAESAARSQQAGILREYIADPWAQP